MTHSINREVTLDSVERQGLLLRLLRKLTRNRISLYNGLEVVPQAI